MFKSRFIQLLTLGFVAFVLSVGFVSLSSFLAPKSLTVGTNPWIGLSGHHVTLQKGFYQQAGLTIQDQFFQSDSEEMAAFIAGKLDLAWLTTGAAMQIVAKEPSSRIIFLVDYSNGSDGILGRNIKTPADVKGKTIAREDILFEKVLLRAYLEKGGLTEKDVVIQDAASAEAAAKAFTEKQVDVAVTYEPFLTEATKEGKGEIIFDTKNTNLIGDAIVVRQSLINAHSSTLRTYLRAADKGVKLIKAGDPQALKIIADRLKLPSEAAVKEQLTGVTLFDLDENKTIVFTQEHPRNLIGHLLLMARTAYDFKVVSQPPKVQDLYDDALVKSS